MAIARIAVLFITALLLCGCVLNVCSDSPPAGAESAAVATQAHASALPGASRSDADRRRQIDIDRYSLYYAMSLIFLLIILVRRGLPSVRIVCATLLFGFFLASLIYPAPFFIGMVSTFDLDSPDLTPFPDSANLGNNRFIPAALLASFMCFVAIGIHMLSQNNAVASLFDRVPLLLRSQSAPANFVTLFKRSFAAGQGAVAAFLAMVVVVPELWQAVCKVTITQIIATPLAAVFFLFFSDPITEKLGSLIHPDPARDDEHDPALIGLALNGVNIVVVAFVIGVLGHFIISCCEEALPHLEVPSWFFLIMFILIGSVFGWYSCVAAENAIKPSARGQRSPWAIATDGAAVMVGVLVAPWIITTLLKGTALLRLERFDLGNNVAIGSAMFVALLMLGTTTIFPISFNVGAAISLPLANTPEGRPKSNYYYSACFLIAGVFASIVVFLLQFFFHSLPQLNPLALAFAGVFFPIAMWSGPVGSYISRGDPSRVAGHEMSRMHLSFLTGLREALRDYPRAVRALLDGIRNQPYLWYIPGLQFHNRGIDAFERQDYDVAIEEFTQALRRNPSLTGSMFHRGLALFFKKAPDDAIRDFSDVVELKPRWADAFMYRGLAYAEKRDDKRAIYDYTRSLELNSRNADAFVYRGLTYFQMGDIETAIADSSRAIELKPNALLGFQGRGMAFAEKGDPARAIPDFTRYLELKPNDPTMLLRRAAAYRALGDDRLAAEDYSAYLRIYPNDAGVQAELRKILAPTTAPSGGQGPSGS